MYLKYKKWGLFSQPPRFCPELVGAVIGTGHAVAVALNRHVQFFIDNRKNSQFFHDHHLPPFYTSGRSTRQVRRRSSSENFELIAERVISVKQEELPEKLRNTAKNGRKFHIEVSSNKDIRHCIHAAMHTLHKSDSGQPCSPTREKVSASS
jgi:hypothetical protein